jgi:metallophosphoesterase (TIGR00282 family)
MRLLMVGDVVGRPGRAALAQLLPGLRTELQLDCVIVNGENAAAGRGLTEQTAREIFRAGADVVTSGNHIFDVREFVPSLDNDWPVIRPANYPPGTPGRGVVRLDGIAVVNLMGRTFMPMPVDDPFRVADALLEELGEERIVVVDFHAEATSEKQAFAWYLDGRVAGVVGTHTHVPTADPRVLPGGTATVTDVGMVGARDSVIGDDVSSVVQRFLSSMPGRLPVAEGKEVSFNSVLIDVDAHTRLANSIERVDRECLLR